MVLMIRNNRIQTSRHSRIKNILSCVVPKDKKMFVVSDKKKKPSTSSSIYNRACNVFFLTTVAMFTLPFVTLFGVRDIMIKKFHSDSFTSNCVAVAAAVLVMFIIIGFYSYEAFKEPSEPSKDDDDLDGSDSSEKSNKKSD